MGIYQEPSVEFDLLSDGSEVWIVRCYGNDIIAFECSSKEGAGELARAIDAHSVETTVNGE